MIILVVYAYAFVVADTYITICPKVENTKGFCGQWY
jgi:hypothetical protein